MLANNRSEQVLEGEILTAGATGTELVPLTSSVRWAPKRPLPHPDPSFITHLIATAAQAPQTCNLRRATLADAQTAYGTTPGERRGVARRTRQVI